MPTDPLREAALAATPGPWEMYEYIHGGGRIYKGRYLVADAHTQENRAYIRAADPTTILRLLDERDALRAALEGLANATASCPDALMAGASHDPAQANLYRWWTERASPALIEAREALRARGAGR